MNTPQYPKALRDIKRPKLRINGAEGPELNSTVTDNLANEILVEHSSNIEKEIFIIKQAFGNPN